MPPQLATLGGAILAETSRLRNVFRRTLCAHIYKIEFWYEISEFKKKMPRRLLKVETKRSMGQY
jgi:hypothetical protein